jgi:nicotinate-nucleotide adenylyltransferase
MLPGTVTTSDGSGRIGVFGGTFDPIHVAHIVAAVEARRALGLDRVVLVPAGDPWQKRGSVAAPAVDRLAMVQAAVDGIAGLEVSPLEVEREGPSYTHQTLEALSAPGRRLFLIVGADVAATMGSWVGIERLPELATLVVVTRADPDSEGAPSDAGAGWEPDERLPARWHCERVEIPRLDVSSTGLRARAAQGWPLDGLVPPGAVRIITDRGLYRQRASRLDGPDTLGAR